MLEIRVTARVKRDDLVGTGGKPHILLCCSQMDGGDLVTMLSFRSEMTPAEARRLARELEDAAIDVTEVSPSNAK